MDYYSILGVAKTATHEEIKKAYRKLAKEHHPDSGGDAEKFKQINEAYSIVGDVKKRQEYDYAPKQSYTGNREYSFNSQDAQAFNEFFKDIFGASAGFHHSQYVQPKNKDLRASISVDLESILTSQRRTLHLKTGRSEKTVEVDIPAGVNNGATIRYKGYGQDILTKAPPGDLVVTIHVKESNHFKRSGADIYSVIKVDAIDAILGTSVEFKNIDGNKISIRVPAGTQYGQTLRIAGKGLPQVNSPTLGNLMLMVEITIPKNITDEQKSLLAQYKDVDIV